MKRLLLCLVALSLSACTQKFYSLNPQSHFDYPNSNIRPIASASGSTAEVSIGFTPPMLSGEIERAAIADALSKQAGSDLLINYVGERKITSFFNLIHSQTYTVTGTAAKMEVGKQYLK